MQIVKIPVNTSSSSWQTVFTPKTDGILKVTLWDYGWTKTSAGFAFRYMGLDAHHYITNQLDYSYSTYERVNHFFKGGHPIQVIDSGGSSRAAYMYFYLFEPHEMITLSRWDSTSPRDIASEIYTD